LELGIWIFLVTFPPPTERQARLIWTALTGLAIALIAGLAVVLIWALGRIIQTLSPVIWPLAVAAVIACLLDPLVDWLQARGRSRRTAIAAVFAIAFLLLVGFFASIVPQLIDETRQLASTIPFYTSRIQKKVQEWATTPPAIVQEFLHYRGRSRPATEPPPPATNSVTVPPEVLAEPVTNEPPAVVPSEGPAPSLIIDRRTLESVSSSLAKVIPALGKGLSQIVSYLASWFGIAAGLALVPIYAFYFLTEKHGISAKWADYLPVRDSHFKKELVFVLSSINNYLIAFFRGQVLVALCNGIFYSIGFLIVGLPYAILLGAAATVLTIIPYLGAITISITALIIALVHSGSWILPTEVLGVFAVVQSLENFVVSPRVMGDRVGLHPVTIIIAVMVGTTLLGGLLGGILAIPLTAALRVVMFRYIWRRET
jgi:predicted PurR-regulated permease PerM